MISSINTSLSVVLFTGFLSVNACIIYESLERCVFVIVKNICSNVAWFTV